MKPISERTAEELEQLREATNSANLPKLIKHHLGGQNCPEDLAQKIATAFNRKWAVDIRPLLTDRSILAVDDAKIRHADNVLGALKELGVAIRRTGNAENLHKRALDLYEARSADANYKKSLPQGYRSSSAMPTCGFQYR